MDTSRGSVGALRPRVGAVLTPTMRWRARDLALGSTGPRRYLAPQTRLDDLFRELNRRGVRYAVLRWFQDLPAVEPGEDIDLLVADEDLEQLETLLRPRPLRWDSQAFDVYSVSGLPGTAFTTAVSYYPPHFARELLDAAVLLRDLYRVPDPLHHFRSLAYHALYHKGYACGLPSEDRPDQVLANPDHDYLTILNDVAQQAGQPPVRTLEGLDAALADTGLRPPLDTLERLAPHNRWISDRFLTGRPGVDPVWSGLAVFVLREAAADDVDLAVDELEKHGFEILQVRPLTAAERRAAALRIRGGNWARGPWPVSGGDPAVFVVGYDVSPKRDGGQPHVNLRIQGAKAEARSRLLRDVPVAERYNPVHSSDSPGQALDYLEIVEDPALLPALRAQAAELADRCRMPFPVIRYLAPDGPARRSRVALVEHPVHGRCVCKVYRPSAIRYFEREVVARRELADLPLTPGLLDSGDNWLVTPYYRDDRRQVLRVLPFAGSYDGTVQLRPEASRALADFARGLHERGFFVLDLTTENLHSDPDAGLKVLDLEFVQRYRDQVPLPRCYSLRGIPDAERKRYDEPYAVPLTGGGIGNPVFHPAVTGLPVAALLRRPLPTGEVLRAVTQLGWFLRMTAVRAPWQARATVVRSQPGRLADRVVRKLVKLAKRAGGR